jgi:integral membrane protein (TIGR01906 family)
MTSMHTAARPATSFLIGLASAVVIITVAILPFLTPQWIAFEQGRANATAWTGYTTEELRTATDAILSDLVFGPPDFDGEVNGEAVLAERERGHMRDVRTVFSGLWLLAAASIVILVIAGLRMERAVGWRVVRRGSLILAGAVMLIGVVALVAFDALFELFHRIFFPGGSYTFNPASERLVQLFPFAFWQETAMVVGVVIIALALVVAAVAGRRPASRAHQAPTRELATAPGSTRS